MGLRAPSFRLDQDGALPANAGLVTETYGQVAATISCAGREIPTKTEWSGRLISGDPAASSYSMLRPMAGDWPRGTLNVVARDCWHDPETGALKLGDRILDESQCEVGQLVEGAAPTCTFVSAPIALHFMSHPGGGSRPPSYGIVLAGICDPYGPLVSIDVEYTIAGIAHVCRAQDIAQARGGQGAVEIPDVDQIQRVRVTNVLGKSLEILPPFPHGTVPAGPLGW